MTHRFLPLLVSSVLHAGGNVGSVTGPPLSFGSWPRHYEVSATHSEPQYVEHVRLLRSGSNFVLIGGVSLRDVPLRMKVQVGSDGSIRGTDATGQEIVCPDAVAVPCALPLRGFLASPRCWPPRGVAPCRACSCERCTRDAAWSVWMPRRSPRPQRRRLRSSPPSSIPASMRGRARCLPFVIGARSISRARVSTLSRYTSPWAAW